MMSCEDTRAKKKCCFCKKPCGGQCRTFSCSQGHVGIAHQKCLQGYMRPHKTRRQHSAGRTKDTPCPVVDCTHNLVKTTAVDVECTAEYLQSGATGNKSKNTRKRRGGQRRAARGLAQAESDSDSDGQPRCIGRTGSGRRCHREPMDAEHERCTRCHKKHARALYIVNMMQSRGEAATAAAAEATAETGPSSQACPESNEADALRQPRPLSARVSLSRHAVSPPPPAAASLPRQCAAWNNDVCDESAPDSVSPSVRVKRRGQYVPARIVHIRVEYAGGTRETVVPNDVELQPQVQCHYIGNLGVVPQLCASIWG